MNRNYISVFDRSFWVGEITPQLSKAKEKGGTLNYVAGSFVLLALGSTSISGWADSCVGQSTTISGYTTDQCFLSAGESALIDNQGVVDAVNGGTIGASLGVGAGDLTIYGQVLNNRIGGNSPAVHVHSGVTQSTITNYGLISSNQSHALAVQHVTVLVSMSRIVNEGPGSIQSAVAAAIWNGGVITDGISNAGTIQGSTAGIFNLNSSVGGFTRTIGNIQNTSTGTITAGGTGSVGIDNGGIIKGISNEGTISGVLVGIRNAGTITQDANGYSIDNRTGTITNGILNTGTLDGKVSLNAATLALNGTAGRVTGDITGNNASTITVNGTFHAEANANVDHIAVNNNASLSFTTNRNWSGSSDFINSGTVAIGTPTSTGVTLTTSNYTQSPDGVLQLAVTNASAGGYSKLVALGTATFNSDAAINVDVNTAATLANGNLLADVVTAQTLNASNFTITDNSALFNFRAIRNGNAVDLRVTSASATGTGIRDAVTEYKNWFALNAAGVLDDQINGSATGNMNGVVTALGQLPSNRDVARATAQTLPFISSNQAIQGVLSTFQNLVQNRTSGRSGATGLSSGDAVTNKNAWGKVFGSRAEQDNRSGAAGFTADTWGLALGAEAEVAPDARFGAAYGYAKTSVDGNTDLSGTAQRSNIDSHVIAVYGSNDVGGNRTFSFQGDIGLNDSKTTRDIEFGGLNRTARADYRTYSARVGAAIAQAFELSEKTTLTPALRTDYTWLKSQAYSERGADALNLNVSSNKTDAFVVGADAYLQHRFSKTSRLDVNFGVGYDAINKQGNIVAAYAGAPGQSFVTTGIDHSPWLMRGGIGYSMLASNGTEVSFRYDAEGRSDYLNHTTSVKAKWTF